MAQNILSPDKYYFTDISFKLLMRKRISQVLIVCSSYDHFVLEEDGRLDEQIFNEYTALNLTYPPQFTHVSGESQALNILKEKKIDLVIIMFGKGYIDPFYLAKKIKEEFPDKPIVLLAPAFMEEIMEQNIKKTTTIDYYFCWLGNVDILLAIVKIIEDNWNVEHDVNEVGLQTILLVEDSIWYYSLQVPNLYKLIFKQSRGFMTEGLNNHQQMLRLRGRPKILLTNNYEEALTLYEKYKNNLLGIISDIGFYKDGIRDFKAGIKLCEKIRNDDKMIPVILQSFNRANEKYAKELNVGFIDKNSGNALNELHEYINEHFMFGDFVFRDPETMQEITRAADLQSFQHKLKEVPDDCLAFHISQNHISKWLNARALFQIAELLKPFQLNDFRDVDDVRNFIFDTIALFRITKRRGIIAEFNSKTFDEYFFFSRIGKGSMGGKARGLAFIDSLIKRNRIFDKFEDTIITIPRTVVIATDIFDEFMRINDLYEIGFSDLSDEEILSHFIKAKLPEEINNDLNAYISVTKSPVAIRSSSLLEDSLFQPFAGIYSTYMIPYEEDNMLKPLSVAIKSVYASVFFKNSKAYLAATSHRIEEEKMAVVLQEICGNKYDNKFYPTISGVARSINFYPIHPEKAEEGIANIAIGLGKYIVNGELSLRFSPKHPKNIIQLADPKIALKETQKRFYALNMDLKKFKPSVDECINILRLDIDEAVNNGSVDQVVSTYDFRNNVIRDGINYEGKKIITFSNILNYNIFPLADIISTLLDIGQREMNNPVEIEFAVNLDVPEGNPKIFNFLQIRPIVEREEVAEFRIDEISKEKSIILSDLALGNGIIDDVKDMIYVKPDGYNPLKNKEIPLKIEKINNELIKQNRKYVLAGPGRWGSADPYLGIPVKWSQISAVKVIVESGLENYRIEPSQGTHFFQNITSFRIGYFTINPYINDGFFDIEYLSKLRAVYEDEYIRHIRFEKPLNIIIDGKNSKGVILKG